MILAVAIGRRNCPVVAICGVGLSVPYLRRFQVKFELVLTGRDRITCHPVVDAQAEGLQVT